MTAYLAQIGRACLIALAKIGRFTLFLWRCLRACLTPPFYGREFVKAVWTSGYLSLPLIGFTTLFAGGALALQIYDGGARFSASEVMPQIVAIGMVRELGPVLVGLMLAARVTSSFAAELGTMQVSEQIDALRTLSTDPDRYLIAPRVWALVLTAPVLVAIGDIIGIFGGFLVAVVRLDFNAALYLQDSVNFLEWLDITTSLSKGAVFGVIVAVTGCYFGTRTTGGAVGVGTATKTAVVTAAIGILAANLILTEALFAR